MDRGVLLGLLRRGELWLAGVCMEHASSSDDRPLPPPRPGYRQLAAAASGLLISLDLLCGAGGPGEDQPQLRLRHRPESVQPAVRGRR